LVDTKGKSILNFKIIQMEFFFIMKKLPDFKKMLLKIKQLDINRQKSSLMLGDY